MPGVSKKYKTKCDKCNEYFSNRQFNKFNNINLIIYFKI